MDQSLRNIKKLSADAFIGFFDRKTMPGEVAVALFQFGTWHLINESVIQAVFASAIGTVFNLAQYRLKNCSYFSIASAHGLYDFLDVVVFMLIV